MSNRGGVRKKRVSFKEKCIGQRGNIFLLRMCLTGGVKKGEEKAIMAGKPIL